MRVQCSIIGSLLGSELNLKLPAGVPNGLAAALTESPLLALQGNQDIPVFYGVAAVGSSPPPALNVFSCTHPPSGTIQDAVNYLEYCTSHDFTIIADAGGGAVYTYTQHDEIDAGSLLPTLANIITDTYPAPGFNGGIAPFWNNPVGYIAGTRQANYQDGATSSAGAPWNKAPTQAAITQALLSVNFPGLWANGSFDPNNPNFFIYDRDSVDPSETGQLPFTGVSGSASGGTFTGNLIPTNRSLGPVQLGRVVFSAGKSLGILSMQSEASDLRQTRVQIQVRNFAGVAPLEYFFLETSGCCSGVTILGNPGSTQHNNQAVALNDVANFYRVVGNGFWTQDLQIVELPLASMDNPQIIGTPLGDRVRLGMTIGMVVGQSFSQFMQNLYGANWRQFAL